MKCPHCAAARLVLDTRDMPYTYKGESTTLPAVAGEFCPACGESVLSAQESARVSVLMLVFNKQVNASIVDPGFIASVRKKLALDQREAAGQLYLPFVESRLLCAMTRWVAPALSRPRNTFIGSPRSIGRSEGLAARLFETPMASRSSMVGSMLNLWVCQSIRLSRSSTSRSILSLSR